jgi:hypothetical protein
MTFLRRRALAGVLLCALTSPVSLRGSATDPEEEAAALRRQRMEAEMALHEWRRFLSPAEDGPAELQELVRRNAKVVGLETIDIAPSAAQTIPLPSGEPSPLAAIRVDLKGRAPYEKVQDLLQLIATGRALRILTFDRIELTAAEGNQVDFTTRVAMIGWKDVALPPTTDSVPPPQLNPREAVLHRERQVLLRHTRHHLETRKTLETLAATYQPERITKMLEALFREGRDQALALTRVRASEEKVALEGVLMGATTVKSFKRLLSDAGFDSGKVELTTAGDCQAFTVTSPLTEGKGESAVVFGNGLFDHEARALCSPAGRATTSVTARGSARPDAITLRMRGVELAEVFRALSLATAESFIINADVKGRLDVDVVDATPDEVLAALRKTGVTISGGPLHYVCRANCRGGTSSGNYEGEPLNLELNDAEARDVLCLFHEVTGLKMTGPPIRERLSVFTHDVPWDQILDGLLGAIGLTYSLEGNLVVLGPAGAETTPHANRVDPCSDRGEYRRPWWKPQRVDALSVADLKLAGVARTGSKWTAFAYGPGASLLLTLERDSKLADGEVVEITADGVTLRGDGAPVVLRLPTVSSAEH